MADGALLALRHLALHRALFQLPPSYNQAMPAKLWEVPHRNALDFTIRR